MVVCVSSSLPVPGVGELSEAVLSAWLPGRCRRTVAGAGAPSRASSLHVCRLTLSVRTPAWGLFVWPELVHSVALCSRGRHSKSQCLAGPCGLFWPASEVVQSPLLHVLSVRSWSTPYLRGRITWKEGSENVWSCSKIMTTHVLMDDIFMNCICLYIWILWIVYVYTSF